MPDSRAVIDYKKCQPDKCQDGNCYAAVACPNKVLKQEEPYEFPISRPSRYCKGCAKCNDACPVKAISIV